jgi:hypothetical protein
MACCAHKESLLFLQPGMLATKHSQVCLLMVRLTSCKTPIRWPRVSPLSHTKPSTCAHMWNNRIWTPQDDAPSHAKTNVEPLQSNTATITKAILTQCLAWLPGGTLPSGYGQWPHYGTPCQWRSTWQDGTPPGLAYTAAAVQQQAAHVNEQHMNKVFLKGSKVTGCCCPVVHNQDEHLVVSPS